MLATSDLCEFDDSGSQHKQAIAPLSIQLRPLVIRTKRIEARKSPRTLSTEKANLTACTLNQHDIEPENLLPE